MPQTEKTGLGERLEFADDPRLAARTYRDLLTGLTQHVPETAAPEIERQLGQRNLFAEFDQGIGADLGLRRSNLAHATAAYWITMWCIVHGRPLPTRKVAVAVVKQLTAMMLSQGAHSRSSEYRQTVAEAMIYEAVLGFGEYRRAREEGDTETLSRMSRNAYRNMRTRGLNFRRVRLGQSGFVGVAKNFYFT